MQQDNQALLEQWAECVRAMNENPRVSGRARGNIAVCEPRGLMGTTLLVAVPSEVTREYLQHRPMSDVLDETVHRVFGTETLVAFVVDPELAEPRLRELFTRDDDVARVRPKVFWGRGQEDPIISEPRVEETHAWLNAHVDLMKIVYAGLGHAINEQELGHVKEYLAHMVPPRG